MRRLIIFIGIVLLPIRESAAQGSIRAALIKADAELSDSVYANGMNAVLPRAVGSDGVLVWPGAGVVQGSAVAAPFFEHQILMKTAKLSWQPFRIELAPDSTLAFMIGVAVFDMSPPDPVPAIHRIGRYLAAWKRVDGTWRLAALSFVNLIGAGETVWTSAIGPRELPVLPSSGPAGAFIAADSGFSDDAGSNGAGKAFGKWAAPDATTFAFSGEMNVGPEKISAVFGASKAHWQWGPVAAGSSNDGVLGWTVGQATVTPASGGAPSKSKYLTLWRRLPDGSIRFIADGGNARP